MLFKYLNKQKPRFSYLKLYLRSTLSKHEPFKYFFLLLHFPILFRIFDPIQRFSNTNINEKCYIIMLLSEIEDVKINTNDNLIKLIFSVFLEIIIFPIRIVFSLILWR